MTDGLSGSDTRGRGSLKWAGRPSAPAVQALRWLGRDAAGDPEVVSALPRQLPDAAKHDLSDNSRDLPGWMHPLARRITADSVASLNSPSRD